MSTSSHNCSAGTTNHLLHTCRTSMCSSCGNQQLQSCDHSNSDLTTPNAPSGAYQAARAKNGKATCQFDKKMRMPTPRAMPEATPERFVSRLVFRWSRAREVAPALPRLIRAETDLWLTGEQMHSDRHEYEVTSAYASAAVSR